MPYIKESSRPNIEGIVNEMQLDCAGDLNYVISTIIDQYLQRHGLRYENINAAIGALECSKLEIYRRIAAPYEDKKIVENGDVFGVLDPALEGCIEHD